MPTHDLRGRLVAPGGVRWVKASASETSDCVEVASTSGAVWIRDSKDPRGPHLTIGRASFEAFLHGLKATDG